MFFSIVVKCLSRDLRNGVSTTETGSKMVPRYESSRFLLNNRDNLTPWPYSMILLTDHQTDEHLQLSFHKCFLYNEDLWDERFRAVTQRQRQQRRRFKIKSIIESVYTTQLQELISYPTHSMSWCRGRDWLPAEKIAAELSETQAGNCCFEHFSCKWHEEICLRKTLRETEVLWSGSTISQGFKCYWSASFSYCCSVVLFANVSGSSSGLNPRKHTTSTGLWIWKTRQCSRKYSLRSTNQTWSETLSIRDALIQ